MFDQSNRNSASNVHLMVMSTPQSAKLSLNPVGFENLDGYCFTHLLCYGGHIKDSEKNWTQVKPIQMD